MINTITIGIVLILILTGAYFVFTSETSPNDLAPSFSLENYDGEIISSDDFVGKIQVVNVWASWCPFCVNEMPDFVLLQEEFPEIVVVGINRGEKKDVAVEYAEQLGVIGGMILLMDDESSYYESIGGFSMPETLFVREDGMIFLHKRGPMTFEEMKEIVNQMK